MPRSGKAALWVVVAAIVAAIVAAVVATVVVTGGTTGAARGAAARQAAPETAAEWGARVAIALNTGDVLAARSLLQLERDVYLEDLPLPELRRAWIAALQAGAGEPGASPVAVCTRAEKQLRIPHGEAMIDASLEERVTTTFQRKDGGCFSVSVDNVFRHPALGWVGATPVVAMRDLACPGTAELRATGCRAARLDGGTLVLGEASEAVRVRLSPASRPGPQTSSAAGWLVDLTQALGDGDWAGTQELLRLGVDLELGGPSADELRTRWIDVLFQFPAGPEATIVAACVANEHAVERPYRGREVPMVVADGVMALYRADGKCFAVEVGEVVRHPALGWVGVRPKLRRTAAGPCQPDEELRATFRRAKGCAMAKVDGGRLVLEPP